MVSAPTDLAYAAGVFDSDGYIGVHRSTYAMRVRGDATQATYQPRIIVKQVEPDAVALIHQLFGGHMYTASPSASRGRHLHVWQAHSKMAGAVCADVLPYLRIKRAQAENVLALCALNRSGGRRWDFPPILDGEEMITMAEAARRLGKSYGVVHQSVRHGNVPHIRSGPRKVLIPASYISIWAVRGHVPCRTQDVTAQMEACFLRAKMLNSVGV